MRPRISVLVCSYNAAPTLPVALKSLEKQTLPRSQFEVVVVDDGSTDATADALKPYLAKPYFRFVRNPVNLGLPASCNRGLAEAAGDLFIRLDADDVFDPRILELLLPAMDRDTDLVFCDRWELVAATGERRRVNLAPFDLFKMTAAATLMRRDLLREVGGYGDMFWEEYDLYVRYLTRSGKPPRHVAEALFTYTLHAGAMTADPRRVQEGWRQLLDRWPAKILESYGSLPDAARRLA